MHAHYKYIHHWWRDSISMRRIDRNLNKIVPSPPPHLQKRWVIALKERVKTLSRKREEKSSEHRSDISSKVTLPLGSLLKPTTRTLSEQQVERTMRRRLQRLNTLNLLLGWAMTFSSDRDSTGFSTTTRRWHDTFHNDICRKRSNWNITCSCCFYSTVILHHITHTSNKWQD